MGRRTILLIAALVVAALGTTLVFLYANRAEETAMAGQSPVQVLVATASVPAGTSGASISQSGAMELKSMPAAAVPPAALSDITPVADLVSLAPIYAGQVLLEPMFGSQQQASGGLTLPKGTVGVSVQLGDPERVAGFVQPGSNVAIFLTVAGAGSVADQQTKLLLDKVPVVAVGPTTMAAGTAQDGTAPSNAEAIPTAIITVALDQEQAQKLIQGKQSGSLQLALVNQDSKLAPNAPGTTTQNVFN